MHERLREALLEACAKAGYETTPDEISSSLMEAKPEFGDVTSTIAFVIAKKAKKNPAEVAAAIAKATKVEKSLVEKVGVVGPYVNFIWSNQYYADVVKDVLEKDAAYGRGEPKGKKVAIEYPSVNPNKPWHAGHLRNALLGNAIGNILEFSGYNIERQNYINDLGLQVAQSIWGYMTLPEPQGVEKFDHLLGLQYVEVVKNAEKLDPEVRGLMKKLEARDASVATRAREIIERCVQAQMQTAFAFGIYENLLIWESDILASKLFEKELERLIKSGVLEKQEEGEQAGCWVVKLDPAVFPSLKSDAKVIIRSDGTATYTAKDIIFQMWKFGIVEHKFKCKSFLKQPNGVTLSTTNTVKGKDAEQSKADIIVNIIGSEQSYPQELIRYILKQMGYSQAENYVHVAYEHVVLPEGKFSGRLGTWIGFTADELLEEAVKRATVEVEKRLEKSGIKGKEKDKVAKMVANAAIKFSFLRITPSKQVIFDFDRAVSFEGDTGPYVQYASVRAGKILEKLGVEAKGTKPAPTRGYEFSPDERALLKKLSQFPILVQKAAGDYQCYYLAEYALEVANAFSKFYETTPVVKAEEKERKTRAAIVVATRTVLTNALTLLGIDVPEKM
jgi:arginyl-tRNA synthetase